MISEWTMSTDDERHRRRQTTATTELELGAQAIDAIARRVVELLECREGLRREPRYVDAATLARELGVERDWIYSHAEQLGAIRLGSPNGRLRFDRERIVEELAALNTGEQPASAASRERRRPARRHKRQSPGTGVRNAKVKSSQIQRRASVGAPARSPKRHQTGGSPE